MNGADRLCDTLLAHGVNVCFANPGTSEMHFVAALDRKPQMRCVLGLFEGVVTGAADGYGRMMEAPAATLLHLGPGLANGLANLHNARRARTPIINVVGEHASHHLVADAPLTSDIESLAWPMSNWVHRLGAPDDVSAATAEAWSASLSAPGVATLILPADAAWGAATDRPVTVKPQPVPHAVAADHVTAVAKHIRATLAAGKRPAILLAGSALREAPLEVAGRICEALGIRMMAEQSNRRITMGRGRVAIDRVPYVVEQGVAFFEEIDELILVGARVPVAFFAYPGKPSRLIRDDCGLTWLAKPGEDLPGALATLAEALGVSPRAPLPAARPVDDSALPEGDLNADAVCRIVARMLPDNAIVCDESVSGGRLFHGLAQTAAPHDYLQITGGAIGVGIPMATGAAVACPDRKVIGLQADGSGMYTIQGLWTQAREQLDVVTVILANRAYAILQHEMRNVGVNQFGKNAELMLSIDRPTLDWVTMARGMGVEGARATTGRELQDLLRSALSRKGPFLIEAVI